MDFLRTKTSKPNSAPIVVEFNKRHPKQADTIPTLVQPSFTFSNSVCAAKAYCDKHNPKEESASAATTMFDPEGDHRKNATAAKLLVGTLHCGLGLTLLQSHNIDHLFGR